MPGLARQLFAWSSPTNETTAETALDIARAVAWKLRSQEVLARAVEATQRQTAFPGTVQWVPHCVALGYAGLALLWAQMDVCFPDEGWDLLGREHLTLAARDLELQDYSQLGIFGGLTGVAFAAWQLSRDGMRYRRLLQTLDDAIVPRTLALASTVGSRNGCSVSEFDAISGLAGIGGYLLCRVEDSACKECLVRVVQALIDLLDETHDDLPRWHTPASFVGDDKSREIYPHGWLNCGLAHGIPGPLALLSLTSLKGVFVPGMQDVIARTADWLCANRHDDLWGVNWPTAVPIAHDGDAGRLYAGSASASPGGPSRCAWCYGSPGIARALWLAGEAIECQRYRDMAISAMEAVFRRPVKERRIDSPSFCHGVAGLLQITLRFANDLGNDAFRNEIDALLQQLYGSYSSEFLIGFRHLEISDNKLDQPGFLDGAPGIAAVLLAAATNAPPTWDRLFLLS